MNMNTLTFVNEDGEDVRIPARYEVCDRCQGSGTHVNPAVDGNGITAEEMDELGDEFLSDYLGGTYDVSCEECGGLRVVLVVDRTACAPALLAEYEAQREADYEYDAICTQERRMGA